MDRCACHRTTAEHNDLLHLDSTPARHHSPAVAAPNKTHAAPALRGNCKYATPGRGGYGVSPSFGSGVCTGCGRWCGGRGDGCVVLLIKSDVFGIKVGGEFNESLILVLHHPLHPFHHPRLHIRMTRARAVGVGREQILEVEHLEQVRVGPLEQPHECVD